MIRHGIMFVIGGAVLVAASAALGTAVVRGIRRQRRTLARGLTAEARCLETYVTHDGDHSSSTRHVILGFRTQDGSEIRIEDTSRVPRVVGDVAQVRYLPDRPHRAIVIGSSPMIFGWTLLTIFCLLLACGSALSFMKGYGVFDPTHPTDPSTVFPNPDDPFPTFPWPTY
ncbi:DUF3592 domain-containing protein [Actinacidiphila acididurans]|uniref:DUF3592 domain-containing protein n=1 Tax=Actinacidiphila acididurans TaxID=2784346 RepID=A0ABS2TZX6_9ACTN|nr:DUF3592 domain-containing protein [Actinacidiphila acididurans]MBM9508904.1 DUF3592 domain-containing protein [Actinacidiphila acididurans]